MPSPLPRFLSIRGAIQKDAVRNVFSIGTAGASRNSRRYSQETSERELLAKIRRSATLDPAAFVAGRPCLHRESAQNAHEHDARPRTGTHGEIAGFRPFGRGQVLAGPVGGAYFAKFRGQAG